MPSSYTQNLGIERPATGEQANTWGDTVNRNMDTLDTAINGNVQLTLSGSPYQLTIDNGATQPVAANPLIIWNGAQTQQGTVEIDWQASRQHLYIMSNQTSGGFPIAFTQGSGSQFVLEAGHDALLYADGRGTGASVAAALANPQFGHVLATGNLQVNGSINGVLTSDAQGNARLTGGLGLGPGGIPDPVTINNIGVGGQLRLVYGNYGVIFRTDGSQFYLMVTNEGDPYGSWASGWPFEFDLATKHVGLGGWGPDGTYILNVPTIQTAGINVIGGRSYFNSGEPYTIGLRYGSSFLTYIGTNSANQFQVSNVGGVPLMILDQGGNASIASTVTAGGLIHVLSGGIMYPDGTIQTTAALVGGVTAQSDATGVRAMNTVYQNQTGKPMFVSVVFSMTIANSQLMGQTDSSPNPTTEVAYFVAAGGMWATVSFWVLPGNYYRANTVGTGTTLQHWTEWW